MSHRALGFTTHACELRRHDLRDVAARCVDMRAGEHEPITVHEECRLIGVVKDRGEELPGAGQVWRRKLGNRRGRRLQERVRW